LLEGTLAQDIEHRLDFLVEIEQLWISIIDLGALAAVLGRHARLEKWHWRPVQVELGEDALFRSSGLIC